MPDTTLLSALMTTHAMALDGFELRFMRPVLEVLAHLAACDAEPGDEDDAAEFIASIKDVCRRAAERRRQRTPAPDGPAAPLPEDLADMLAAACNDQPASAPLEWFSTTPPAAGPVLMEYQGNFYGLRMRHGDWYHCTPPGRVDGKVECLELDYPGARFLSLAPLEKKEPGV